MTTEVKQTVVALVAKTNSTGSVIPPAVGTVPTADGAGTTRWLNGGGSSTCIYTGYGLASVAGGDPQANILNPLSTGSLTILPADQGVGQVLRLQISYDMSHAAGGTAVTLYLLIDGDQLATLVIPGTTAEGGMATFRFALDGTTAAVSMLATQPSASAAAWLASTPWDVLLPHTIGVEAAWNGGAAAGNVLRNRSSTLEALLAPAALV